ncbi:MAG: hemerythrin family protein [Deltaproteobacteria bacterium]|nr:hemerythrin family protein [Deltaproteobacteria bacterium]
MAIEWSKNLSTGVDWQDRQHKELFKRINSLLDAMSVGRGKEEVLNLIRFIGDYFVVHFESEEKAMGKYDFPGAIAHIAEHTGLMEDFTRFKDECRGRVSTADVIKVQRRIVNWLINHIGGSDKALGAFILRAEEGDKRD